MKYWISNLPANIPAKDLARPAKARRRIEHDYRELKTCLGLDHFEGRSFVDWDRQVTLVTAAHLFLTEQRTCPKGPCQGLPPDQALDLLQHLIATRTGTCPTCRQPTPRQPHDTRQRSTTGRSRARGCRTP